MPVAGYMIRIVKYVLRLPTIVRNHERLEAVLFQRELELRRELNAMQAITEQQLATVQREGSKTAEVVHIACQHDLRAVSEAVGRGTRRLAELEATVDASNKDAERLSKHIAEVEATVDASNKDVERFSKHIVEVEATIEAVKAAAATCSQHLERRIGESSDRWRAVQASMAAVQESVRSGASQVNTIGEELLGIAERKVDRSYFDNVLQDVEHAMRKMRDVVELLARGKGGPERA